MRQSRIVLLMLQKSRIQQLRLVVYGFLNHQQFLHCWLKNQHFFSNRRYMDPHGWMFHPLKWSCGWMNLGIGLFIDPWDSGFSTWLSGPPGEQIWGTETLHWDTKNISPRSGAFFGLGWMFFPEIFPTKKGVEKCVGNPTFRKSKIIKIWSNGIQ